MCNASPFLNTKLQLHFRTFPLVLVFAFPSTLSLHYDLWWNVYFWYAEWRSRIQIRHPQQGDWRAYKRQTGWVGWCIANKMYKMHISTDNFGVASASSQLTTNRMSRKMCIVSIRRTKCTHASVYTERRRKGILHVCLLGEMHFSESIWMCMHF